MPFSFMTLRPLLSLVAVTLLAAPVLLTAQTSSSEEERLEKLMADSAQWYVPRTTVSVGFRMLSSGGKVAFGNLGSVPFNITVPPRSDGEVSRSYNNGEVLKDGVRNNEGTATDTNGDGVNDTLIQNSTPGTRYAAFTTYTKIVRDAAGNAVLNEDGTNKTESVTVQTGDMIAYTPGQTRSWGYGSSSQLTADGRVAMSTYSAVSEGQGYTKEAGASGGVEFQYVRTLSKPTARLQWGILGGITLNGINSKTAGTVTATLKARTDYYSLLGNTAPEAPYSGPTFADYLDPATGTVVTHPDTGADLSGSASGSGVETTPPLASTPDGPTVETSVAGGATVEGNWQIKGAYFMMRLGPTIRTQLTQRLGVNASIGLAGAFAGTSYSAFERFQVPDLDGSYVGSLSTPEQSTANKFLSGYYADVNIEWVANERTGLFGGFTAQKFDGYDQFVGSRTARIDLGSSVGVRGGVSIKF